MSRGAILAGVAVLALAAGAAIGLTRERSNDAPVAPPAASTPPATRAATSAVVAITDAEQLKKLLAEHHGTALLDFHAEWCRPCKELAPRVAELAGKRPGLLVASVDVVAVETVGNAYRAEDLPLLVRVEDGKEVARQVGAPTLAELERWLDQPPKP